MRISDWSSDVCSSDLLDLRDFCGHFGDALEHRKAKLGMAHLAAAKAHGHLDLVAFAQKVEHLLHLHVEVVIVDIRTHLDLLDQIGRASCRERVCQYV